MRHLGFCIILPAMILAGMTACADQGNLPGGYPLSGAAWISDSAQYAGFSGTSAAPLFRKTFAAGTGISRAMIHYTGAGYVEASLNGKRITEDVLEPSFTRYDKRVEYMTRDITRQLVPGENCIGLMAGNGFYNVDTKSAWSFREAPWRNRPCVICRIDLHYEDGHKEIVLSDSTWECHPGPVVFNQLRNGETYDTRKEIDGWNLAGRPPGKWKPAWPVEGPAGKLVPAEIQPMRVMNVLQPVEITTPAAGIYLVDFGQNIAGWTRVVVSGQPGQEIIIRHGERVNPDGSLDQKELSRFIFTGETQTSRYICKGTGVETWEPRFTYYGFQYAQIEGLSHQPSPGDIVARVVHTSFKKTGNLVTSDSLVNQIHRISQWSYLGNFHGYPEDCPHREKMGWTGDGQLTVEMGLLNYDAAPAYRKWLRDFADEQRETGDLPGIVPTSGWGYTHGRDPAKKALGYGPQWEGAAVVIPWTLYQYSGDRDVLSEFYPMMKKYARWLAANSSDGLLDFGIDDHKSLIPSSPAVISSAFYFRITSIMARVSDMLGFRADSEEFSTLAANTGKAYMARYLEPALDSDSVPVVDIALALDFDMVPPADRRVLVNKLVSQIERDNDHLYNGVVGCKAVMGALFKNGRKEVLFRIISRKDFPSYGNWISMGANTLWQNWDGSQSRNHVMFGFVDEYLMKLFLGISQSEAGAGFTDVTVVPYFPSALTSADASITTTSGIYRSTWNREDNLIRWELTLPREMHALVEIPPGYHQQEDRVRELEITGASKTSYLLALDED